VSRDYRLSFIFGQALLKDFVSSRLILPLKGSFGSMKVPRQIRLGPLTNRIVRQASGKWKDLYPATQGYANECESLLEFVADRNQFDRFLSRLCARREQRDEALNEIRAAYLIDLIGYPILAWEPTDKPPRNVEFLVDLGVGFGAGYVEVKSPGWQAELSRAEQIDGRKKLPKNIDAELRAATPVEVIRRTVEKAAPKFSGNHPSLIVISDDCFVNLGNWGWGPLHLALTSATIAYEAGLFTLAAFQSVGGVALLWAKSTSPKGVEYAAICLANPNAQATATLPLDLVVRLCTKLREPSSRKDAG